MSFTLKPVFALGAENQPMARNPGGLAAQAHLEVHRARSTGPVGFCALCVLLGLRMEGTKPKVFLSKRHIIHDALPIPSCSDSFRCDAGAGPQESAPSPTP